MSVTLSQSPKAAFPDRNPQGHGLSAELETDGAGQFIALTTDTPKAQLHSRFMFAPVSSTRGAFTIAGAVDSTGHYLWSLRYDADARQLTLATPNGSSLQTSLLDGLPWFSIEVGYDTTTNAISLWINGQLVESLALSSGSNGIARCLIGVVQKEDTATGEVYFDEWIIADDYIGPAMVEPSRPYADDPARWLVVYNTAISESIAWVESYRQARGIPLTNCVGLDLSLNESISTAEYESMLALIEQYLDQNGLRGQIMGILVGYRVPGYAVPSGTNLSHPIPSLLHHPQANLFSIPNPVATETLQARPTHEDLGLIRLTARIDAPDLDLAKRFHQRAVELIDQPLESNDWLYVDPTTLDFSLPTWAQRIMDWYNGLERQKLRLSSSLSGDPNTQNQAQFSSIEHDAFYWGWGPAHPPTGFFGPSAGPRIACVQLRSTGVNATTLRSPSPDHWIDAALDAGYAAAVGTSLSSSTDSLLYAQPFFEALRCGWTLAEAYLLASPRVQDGYYLVGDPLLKAETPKAGWDVFGPLSRPNELVPDRPGYALAADEYSAQLAGDALPDENQTGLYLVRQIDEHGRTEASFSPLNVMQKSGSASLAPPPIVWPDHEHWGLNLREGVGQATLILGLPRNRVSLVAVELLNDQDNNATAIAIDAVNTNLITVDFDLPTVVTRYRWKISFTDDLISYSPWSAVLAAASINEAPLTVLEPR